MLRAERVVDSLNQGVGRDVVTGTIIHTNLGRHMNVFARAAITVAGSSGSKSWARSMVDAEIETGPVIAQYEVQLEAGLRLSKITGLADDLAIALRVPSVRIVAP